VDDEPRRDTLTAVTGWLSTAARVTALTGAGISTASGIPDYRGPQGMWTRDPQAARTSTFQHYVADPAVRRRAWQLRKDHAAWTAVPNDAHRALVELERSGKLTAIVTQNIDELHQRAGSSADCVVELHGTMWRAVCLTCDTETPMRYQLARISDGVPDPPCELCGGILKSATISFGQSLDQAVLARAVRAARSCDVFLAIGSSLTVQPAAGLCSLARECGARLVVVNGEPTGYDELADAVVRGRTEEVLPRLVRGALDGTSTHGA
jgi:NAD-dependent deacetylase